MTHKEILHFWFTESRPEQWFEKNPAFDQLIASRFSEVHQKARRGELWTWRESLQGRLAEIIVLDQFSRNIYRDQPASFACDTVALVLAQEAVAHPQHKSLSSVEKSFLFLPFMHSESAVIHKLAVELYAIPGLEMQMEYELKHKEIIDRFGRFPHRNRILNRASTAEEIEFLKQPNSSF